MKTFEIHRSALEMLLDSYKLPVDLRVDLGLLLVSQAKRILVSETMVAGILGLDIYLPKFYVLVNAILMRDVKTVVAIETLLQRESQGLILGFGLMDTTDVEIQLTMPNGELSKTCDLAQAQRLVSGVSSYFWMTFESNIEGCYVQLADYRTKYNLSVAKLAQWVISETPSIETIGDRRPAITNHRVVTKL